MKNFEMWLRGSNVSTLEYEILNNFLNDLNSKKTFKHKLICTIFFWWNVQSIGQCIKFAFLFLD